MTESRRTVTWAADSSSYHSEREFLDHCRPDDSRVLGSLNTTVETVSHMSRIPASHIGEDASRLLKELEEHVRGTIEYIQKGRFTMTSTNLTSKKDKSKRRALIGDSEASIREIVTQLGALSLDPGQAVSKYLPGLDYHRRRLDATVSEFLPARASEGLDTSERATEDEGYRQV